MAAPKTTSGAVGVEDSQGTWFIFNTTKFKATKVTRSHGGSGSAAASTSQVDVSHLGLASGANKEYQSPPLNEVSSAGGTGVLATISVDFLGLEEPDLAEHKIDLGAKLKVSGMARCTEYNLTASVGEVLKGSATFELTVRDVVYTPIVLTP